MKKYVIHIKQKIRDVFNQLSHKQKLVLIFGLLFLFLVADVFYIGSGFTESDKPPKPLVERHIEALPLIKSKNSNPLKPLEYGKETKSATDTAIIR